MVQSGPPLGVVDAIPELERVLELAVCLRERAARFRSQACLDRCGQRGPEPVAGAPMEGQFAGRAAVRGRRQSRIGGQRLRKRQVEGRPLAGKQVGVDALGEQRVAEGVCLVLTLLDQDLMADGFSEGFREPGFGKVRDGREERVRDTASRGCGYAEQPLRGRRQRLDPDHQRVTDGGGKALSIGRGGEQLFAEERVAFGALEQPRGELGIGRRSQDPLDLSPKLRGGERLELEHLHPAEALVFSEERAKGMLSMQLVAAVRADHEQRLVARVADQKRQQVAGRAVGPVQVLDREHEWTFGAQVDEQRAKLLEHQGLGKLTARR